MNEPQGKLVFCNGHILPSGLSAHLLIVEYNRKFLNVKILFSEFYLEILYSLCLISEKASKWVILTELTAWENCRVSLGRIQDNSRVKKGKILLNPSRSCTSWTHNNGLQVPWRITTTLESLWWHAESLDIHNNS